MTKLIQQASIATFYAKLTQLKLYELPAAGEISDRGRVAGSRWSDPVSR